VVAAAHHQEALRRTLGVLLSVLALSACAGSTAAPQTPQAPAVKRTLVRVATHANTNCGRLLRIMVRQIKEVDFERFGYADVLAMEDAHDPFVLAAKLILPGGTPEFEVDVPLDASVGFFFLLTEDAESGCSPLVTSPETWKRLLTKPCATSDDAPALVAFELGERLSGIKQAALCGGAR
jgi:IglE, N-terminal domain